MYLVFDHGGSNRASTPFLHLPAYIQAERGGFLGFNFAWWDAAPMMFRKPEDPEAVLPELAGQTFHPFTDLLLHDLGPDLADEKRDGEAQPGEWRTPPLWGIGLFRTVNDHERYLHDGRARGLAEAVLWHAGEATTSRERFRNASRAQRDELLAFLRSL